MQKTSKGDSGSSLTASPCRPRCARCKIVVLARMNVTQSLHSADQRPGSASVVTRAKRMAQQTGYAMCRPSGLIPGMSEDHKNESAAFVGPLHHHRRCRQLALTNVVVNTSQRGSAGRAERDHTLCALAPHRSLSRLKAPCPILVGSPAPVTWGCATSLGRGRRKTH